ncbi:hypothetical protein FACS1894132_02640 [Clostridia bacterium]|nr:hypothetical protein FACS1894132_02640 [Clostridia bacterium]
MTEKIAIAIAFLIIVILGFAIVFLKKEDDFEILPMITDTVTENVTSLTTAKPKTTTKNAISKTTTAKITTTSKTIYSIDLNTATYEDFLQLGITSELALACIELRGKIYYFSNVLELLYADGMTNEIYRRIKDYCYVGSISENFCS